MIGRRGNLLDLAVTGLAGGDVGFDVVYSVSELRAASEPDPALPVVLKVASELPAASEGWPSYKARVEDRLADASDRLARTAGVEVHQLLIAANSLAASLTVDQLEVVAEDPELVLELAELDPLLDVTALDGLAADIGLRAVMDVHPDLDGTGVRVAVLDSGVDGAHPALIVSDGVSTCGEAIEIPGQHGTHCAGILASRDGVFRGVAPGVELVNIKVLRADGSGRHTYVVRGIDEALDRGVDICSMSLGFNHLPADSVGGHGWQCPDGRCPLCFAVDNAVAQGVVMVAAAGNDHLKAQQLVAGGRGNGYDTELSCPGQAIGALCVGNHAKRSFAPAPASSNGPTAFGALKPELVAPGVQILSTVPLPRDAGGKVVTGSSRALQFGAKSGTSMATPAVAGTCALLVQRARGQGDVVDPASIRQALLRDHVEALGGPAHVVGAGRLRLGF